MITRHEITTELTQPELMSVLSYNHNTGLFIWRKARGGRAKGDRAGVKLSDGYIQIMIKYKKYSGHRLAFLYMTGRWPKEQVDHINRVPSDNRWYNLRECDKFQNSANRTKNKNNTSGYKGVYENKKTKKWTAQVGPHKKGCYLGTFKRPEDAALAYNKKSVELYGEFAFLNVIGGNGL